MSYTPPPGGAVDFVERGGTHTPPLGGAVDFVEGAGGAAPTGVIIGLPLAVTVASSAVTIALPIAITIATPAVATLPLGVQVVDAVALGGLDGAAGWAAAPGGAWRPVVTLDGADISARLFGHISVTHAADAAATAEFSWRPDAPVQPLDLIGRPVRIAFARADGSAQQTLFSGVVDVPSIDLDTGLIACACHDQAQEVWARAPREHIDSLVGGRFSVAISGDDLQDAFEYLRERIQSVAASWALDVHQRPRVLPWSSPARTLVVRTADVIGGSLAVSLPSREQLRSRVTCRLQYQYTRLRYRGVQAQYAQSIHFFKPWRSGAAAYPGARWLTTAMVHSACESVPGWTPAGPPVIEHPPARSWAIGNSPADGFYTISPAVAPDLAMAFTCQFSARWQQRITEDYTVDVVWPTMESQLGAAVGEEIGATLVAEFDQPGWDVDPTMAPLETASGLGDRTVEWRPPGVDGAARDHALRTLLDRAWVRLWAASRSGRVDFTIPLRPDLWLDTRITLEHASLRAAGDITQITHIMDLGAGTALSEISLAVGMPGATPAAHPNWTLPAPPLDPYTPPLSAYSFEVGTYLGGEVASPPWDPDTMIGFSTNLNGIDEQGRNYYPHELNILAPNLAAEDRDPLSLAATAQIAVSVPTDLLEIP